MNPLDVRKKDYIIDVKGCEGPIVMLRNKDFLIMRPNKRYYTSIPFNSYSVRNIYKKQDGGNVFEIVFEDWFIQQRRSKPDEYEFSGLWYQNIF